jgi:hypothetical protein
MAIERWHPTEKPTKAEERILARLKTHRKLFAFLRLHRHEILDDEFQDLLASMYRDTGAGAPAQPPAMLCMALLLQAYDGVSDREAVERTVDSARWQMVLACLGENEPAFSQGGLQQFRERLIEHDVDIKLLERTVAVARCAARFDWRKLPKSLRVAMDSRPLVGAGRVEDTFNLLGHAARKIGECAADLTGISFNEICTRSGAPVLLASSVKAGLDVDWSNDGEKAAALESLVIQVRSLAEWVGRATSGQGLEGPITKYLEALQQVQDQNLDETDGRITMHQGVAPDRRVSIEDEEMRHGRKSKSQRFNGYKEHVAADLDTGVILACVVKPANVPEEEAAPILKRDIEAQGLTIAELAMDRGYLNSSIVDDIEKAGGDVVCKPWPIGKNKGFFSKRDFDIDVRAKTITCPAGQVEPFEPGDVVEFDPDACGPCLLRAKCTQSSSGRGRTVRVAEDERRQQRLRRLQKTPKGRERLRQRTAIEHRLAHIEARKGRRARYIGARKNTFDLRRASAIQNLETAQRASARAA